MLVNSSISLPIERALPFKKFPAYKFPYKYVISGLFLRKVARECQNALVISFARAIAQVKVHKHCLFLGKASYNESRYCYCQMRMNRWNTKC